MSWPSEHLFAPSEQQHVTSPQSFACVQIRVGAITVYYPVGVRLSLFVFILAGITCYVLVVWLSTDLRAFCVNVDYCDDYIFIFYDNWISLQRYYLYIFDTHGSVHRRLLSRNTNKMQLCNRMYYSKVFWRLNMFRAAHRSSSGALNCICSLWFICPCGDRPFGNGRSPNTV
jgi:hypothetical protein